MSDSEFRIPNSEFTAVGALLAAALASGCAAVAEPRTETPDRPELYTPPHVADRRAAWDPALARYTNTGVRRPPVWFPSPTQDTYLVGDGEPVFHDYAREKAMLFIEPAIFAINLPLLPVRMITAPYWSPRLDYGPLDPSRPPPPERVIETPETIRVDE